MTRRMGRVPAGAGPYRPEKKAAPRHVRRRGNDVAASGPATVNNEQASPTLGAAVQIVTTPPPSAQVAATE